MVVERVEGIFGMGARREGVKSVMTDQKWGKVLLPDGNSGLMG